MTSKQYLRINELMAAGEAAKEAGDRDGLAKAIVEIFRILPDEEFDAIMLDWAHKQVERGASAEATT